MRKGKAKVFYQDQVDNRTKVICVFGSEVSNDDIKEYVSKFLEEHEMDEEDEYAPIQSKIDCNVFARSIVDGHMEDFDIDRYWIEEVEIIL